MGSLSGCLKTLREQDVPIHADDKAALIAGNRKFAKSPEKQAKLLALIDAQIEAVRAIKIEAVEPAKAAEPPIAEPVAEQVAEPVKEAPPAEVTKPAEPEKPVEAAKPVDREALAQLERVELQGRLRALTELRACLNT